MGEIPKKAQKKLRPKPLGTVLALSLATLLGIVFWRRRRSF